MSHWVLLSEWLAVATTPALCVRVLLWSRPAVVWKMFFSSKWFVQIYLDLRIMAFILQGVPVAIQLFHQEIELIKKKKLTALLETIGTQMVPLQSLTQSIIVAVVQCAKSCPVLCIPMDWSMLSFHVFHYLLQLAQTHVHWVSDAIQPSYPLLPPSPPALSLSQHQGLFQWIGPLHQVAKVLVLLLQRSSFQWIFRVDFL